MADGFTLTRNPVHEASQIQALIRAAETAPGRFAKTAWGSTRIRHTAGHEALIVTFEAEGWDRAEAEYKAYRLRKAFVPGTPDAELIRHRLLVLEQIGAKAPRQSQIKDAA